MRLGNLNRGPIVEQEGETRIVVSDLKGQASAILKEFKGDSYAFGSGVLDEAQ
jgi:hypothetical protein